MAGFDKNNMPFGMKIVVVIFAVILVVSLCLPFFSSCNLPGQEPQNTAQEETTQQEDEGVTTANATTAADIDASYEAQKLELESKLESDPNNLSALANLGNLYYSWAQDLKSIASETNLELIESSEPADSDGETTSSESEATSPESEATSPEAEASTPDGQESEGAAEVVKSQAQVHIDETFEQAISYYDRYLALDPDSKSVSVNRISCIYTSGQEEQAISELEDFTATDDSFSYAWYTLGMFYFQQGENEKAKAAFDKAAETDAVDPYGYGTMAQIYSSLVQSYIDAEAEAAAEVEAESEDAAQTEETSEPLAPELSDSETSKNETASESNAPANA